MINISNDERVTPQNLFDKLDEEFGFDPERYPEEYFTKIKTLKEYSNEELIKEITKRKIKK